MAVDVPPCRVFASPVLRPSPNIKWASSLTLGNGTIGLVGASDSTLYLWDPSVMIEARSFTASKPFVKPVFGLITSVSILPSVGGPERLLVLSDAGTLTSFQVAHDRLALELDFQMCIEMKELSLSPRSLGFQVVCDPLGRAFAVSALESRICVWPMLNGKPEKNPLQILERGIIWSMAFLTPTADSKQFIEVLLAVVNDQELWTVLYEISGSSVTCTGTYMVGRQLTPMHLKALPSIPGSFLLFTDTGMFAMSTADLKIKGALVQKIDIPGPFHSMDIPEKMEALVSDIVIVPPTLSSLTGKQLLFLSSDAGHLIRVSVDLTSTNEASKPSAQFRHVTIPRNPILLMASLGKFENKDIIALFGDLCEGEIAMVAPYEVTPLVTIPNGSPCLDAALIPSIRAAESDTLMTTQGLTRGGLVASQYKVRVTVEVEADGFEGATEIWSLKENHPDKSHKYLVVSFLSNTRIMQMSNEALEDVSDSCGLDTNAQTLFVTKLIGDSSNLVVQITETSVIICKLDSTIKLCQWDISDGPIICGYAVEEQVIVATKGGILVLLNILIAENAAELVESNRAKFPSEISTVYIPSLQLCADGVCLRRVCIVGTHTPSVQVLSLESEDCFRVLTDVILDVDVSSSMSERELRIPNSITLFDEEKMQDLLVGLRDGHMNAYQWQWIIGGKGPTLTTSESRKLGVSPVVLITDMYQTFNRILALSDTTWLITSVERHLNHVPLSSSKALHAAPFSYPNFNTSYMLLQDSKLKFVQYNMKDTVDIKSEPIPDIPRRLLFDTFSEKLLIGTWKKSGTEIMSDVKILDVDTGRLHHGTSLQKNERLTVLAKWIVEHASRPGKRYVCIGTGNYRETSPDDPKGRVLIYSFKQQTRNEEDSGLLKLKKLGELVLPQNVQCVIAFMQSYLLVGAGTKVYRLKIEAKDRRLVIADSLDTRWAVQALDVYPMEDGPLVAVACQKESISIYKYLASDKKFEFLSSDRVSRIPTSIQFLDPHRIVGVDKHGHIFGLYNRVTRSASNVLERSMDILFHVKIGEPLVKVFTGDLRPKVLVDVPLHDFKGEDKSWFTHQSKELFWNPGCLDLGWSSSDESSGILQAVTAGASVTYPPIGRTLYGLTISGLLYGFLRIPESLYRDLLLFQELLTEEPFTKPVLGHDHSASRQCNSTIDGEFVAQFLDLGLSKKQEIVDKWNARMEERSRHGVPPASVESVTRVLSLILKCI